MATNPVSCSLPASSKRWLPILAILLTALMFTWSITGTIALRNVLLGSLLITLPLAGVDVAALRRNAPRLVLALFVALTLWIVAHNLFFAWESARAWRESVQWFTSIACLGLGLALGFTPETLEHGKRWRFWAIWVALAFGLHLVLNLVLKDWSQSGPFGWILQTGTRIGTRDMISYLGTGLLAFLLADLVVRFSGGRPVFPINRRWLAAAVSLATLLSLATMTRNVLPVIGLELAMAVLALIGAARTSTERRRRTLAAVGVLAFLLVAGAANLALDARWKNFMGTARVAWDIEHEHWWIDQTAQPWPKTAEGVLVDHSSYSRIAWMKGACKMIAAYPLGTGYDRNAFRRALMKHYGAANTAAGHAHAGLLDFTLATGIPGGALLIAAFLAAIGFGWRQWRRSGDPAGLALSLFVASYLLRAAIDGIVRDHMLEQAMFLTGLLLAAAASTRDMEKDKT